MANNTAPQSTTITERRRVLVIAENGARKAYLTLRGPAPFRTWDVVEADSFERAHFILQMDHCDAVIVDGSVYRPNDDALSWLLSQHPLPVLLVANREDAVAALLQGASQWLPPDVALAEPALLSETVFRVVQLGEWQRRTRVAGEALQDARRQVSRLVSLLWEVTPTTGGTRWFTQRHMMERLYQETSRCERHAGALSVVLGEMHSQGRTRLSPEELHELASWTAERIALAKRRCDVAGQYGPHGFMLLLPGSTNIGAVACCKRIQAHLEMPDAPVPQLQAYFGVSAYSSANASVKALLSRAEERLEQARTGAGERVVA
jgi:diguanylate cyclase (GGDEF)-like protein